jgi:hypothetical protein
MPAPCRPFTSRRHRLASSSLRNDREPPSYGRGFAAIDPERQREVIGYVRSGPIETTPAQRPTAQRPTRLDWMRVQPERDGSNFEGSSSRRSR